MTLINQDSPSHFLQEIIKTYQKDGALVGEDRNIACLFFVVISKYLQREYRLHATIVSESSAGKSKLAHTITEPFNEDLKYYTRFTGAGLDRKTESYNGKIFYYEQMNGFEPSQLKVMLSEGELSILVVETDELGRKKPIELKIKGMPVFITTSTNPNIDQELLNRTLTLTLDESKVQTRAIMKQHAKRFSILHKANLNKWSYIIQLKNRLNEIRLETICQIIVPFSDLVADKLPDHLNMRRDFDKILRLTALIAYTKSITYRGWWENSKVEGFRSYAVGPNTNEGFDI